MRPMLPKHGRKRPERLAGRKNSGLRLRRRREHPQTPEKYPQSIVKGVDYSAVSVEKAQRLNRDAITDERCAVWQGSVSK